MPRAPAHFFKRKKTALQFNIIELLICRHEEDEGFVYVLSLESIIKMDKYYILVMVLNLFLTSWAQKDLQGHSRSSE